MQNNESLLDPSALIGLASARRSVKAQRKYPKLIEPKTSKKTRKIPMSVQTSSPRSNNNDDDYLIIHHFNNNNTNIKFEYSNQPIHIVKVIDLDYKHTKIEKKFIVKNEMNNEIDIYPPFEMGAEAKP